MTFSVPQTSPLANSTDPSVMTIAAGHALVQNILRKHYDLAVDSDHRSRVADAFDELMIAI